MRVKVKKAVHSNSLIEDFINKVISTPFDNLAAALANFRWIYDKVSLKSLFQLLPLGAQKEDPCPRHASSR